MKTISTLLTSLLFSIAIFAADAKPKSTLTVKSLTQNPIRVMIDGKQFDPNSNTLMVDNVNQGYHTVVVYRKNDLGFFGKTYHAVYNGSVAVKAGNNVLITIDKPGRADVTYQSLNKGRRGNRNKGYNDWNRNDNGYFEDNGNYSSYARAMSATEFNQVMSSMQREWFEANRMKSAIYIISNNFFTADQVKDMISLFSFENNKLELAKQAYTRTLDKQNYYCVSESLNFQSGRDELARFIRSCK